MIHWDSGESKGARSFTAKLLSVMHQSDILRSHNRILVGINIKWKAVLLHEFTRLKDQSLIVISLPLLLFKIVCLHQICMLLHFDNDCLTDMFSKYNNINYIN